MKKILLTGASGFIGKNLKELLEDKYELFCPSHSELDLMDGEAVRDYLEIHHFDAVIHSATLNTTKQQVSPADVFKHNLTMFFNLERCNSLYGKLIYFGSGAEYDRNYINIINGTECVGIHSITEEEFDRSTPKDSYSMTKYIMAKSADQSTNIYDLCLFGVYGKYEESDRRFISNVICQACELKEIKIKQNAVYDYLYVDDLAYIVSWFVENKPRFHRYNVCSGKKYELIDLSKLIQTKMNQELSVLVEREGLNGEYTADNKRLCSEIKDLRFTDIDEGIEKMIAVYG